jgi:hypothetical protein
VMLVEERGDIEQLRTPHGNRSMEWSEARAETHHGRGSRLAGRRGRVRSC